MAYPYHYLFSFGGTLLGGADIWSNNIRFVASGTPDEQYDLETRLEEMMTALAVTFATGTTRNLGYSQSVALRWGKLNAIGPDGKYASSSESNVYDLPNAPVVGNTEAPSKVPQIALAVSWGTERARGHASKGRIYVPMPSVEPASTGRVPTATCQTLATAWATQIDELNDIIQGVGQERPIASVVSGISGAWAPITTVRVGNVLDTQRSRRSALVEAYSTADVPDSE